MRYGIQFKRVVEWAKIEYPDITALEGMGATDKLKLSNGI